MTADLQEAAEEARRLIESVHFANGDAAQASPLVFGPGAPGAVVCIMEEGRVRSACGVLVRDLVIGGLSVRVGLVGAVSTDPDHRGRGLATRLLAEAEARLASEGCALALLWADDPGFYAARGYAPVGEEIDCLLGPSLVAGLPDTAGVREAVADDAEAIHGLYLGHRERVDRSLGETRSLLRSPGMEVLVKEAGGAVVAYACRGRGEDLRGVVHEWAGLPEDVLSLVRHFLEHSAPDESIGQRLFLMVPPSADRLLERLQELGVPSSCGILGMGKLLDPAAAASLLWSTAGNVPELLVESDGQTTLLRSDRGASGLDEAELLQVLFGAQGDRTLHEDLEADLGVRLPGLPLTPFVWGLDSI